MTILTVDSGHERVIFFRDQASGLRAIIAVYSTFRGPAVGGTRFYPYVTEDDTLADVLDLSRAMAYKAAGAGLALGGGKAVIIGDPARDKSAALLRAYGRAIDSLGGRYYTACDVGTYPEDMDVIARETPFVTGRTAAAGGSGDSSILTAVGVFQGMRAAAETVWGSPSLRGRRVGISGVGKVGAHLVDHLVADGATVDVADVDDAAVDRVRASHPAVGSMEVVDLPGADLDVWAPCALGHAITGNVASSLRARIVCGGANNQLAAADVGTDLDRRGILYAPDYIVNAGGLIQLSVEMHGYDHAEALRKVERIFDTTLEVFRLAAEEGVPPSAAADRMAESRMENRE